MSKKRSAVFWGLISGFLRDGFENSGCAGDKILNKKRKNLPSPKLKKVKHKRNKKTGF